MLSLQTSQLLSPHLAVRLFYCCRFTWLHKVITAFANLNWFEDQTLHFRFLTCLLWKISQNYRNMLWAFFNRSVGTQNQVLMRFCWLLLSRPVDIGFSKDFQMATEVWLAILINNWEKARCFYHRCPPLVWRLVDTTEEPAGRLYINSKLINITGNYQQLVQ